MVRGIAWKTRRDDEWNVDGIGTGLPVAIRVPAANRCFGAPEIVAILVEERRDQTVTDRHIDQRERARILRERAALLPGDLLSGLIEDLCRRRRGVKGRDIRAI